jgi:hypothetical protein
MTVWNALISNAKFVALRTNLIVIFVGEILPEFHQTVIARMVIMSQFHLILALHQVTLVWLVQIFDVRHALNLIPLFV